MDLRGAGNWAGQLLPMATPEPTGCNRTDASSGINSERATPGSGCSKQRTVLRPSPRGGLCHAARRRKVSVLGAEHVPDFGRASASERKKRSAAPSLLSSPRAYRSRPNQVWSWDITKLMGPAKWTYFYLYVILDIFSRYVVGWMLAYRESASWPKNLSSKR